MIKINTLYFQSLSRCWPIDGKAQRKRRLFFVIDKLDPLTNQRNFMAMGLVQ